MRALAVGMVVVYHLYPSLLTGGFAGVDVFFVISGFLITGHLLREYHKTGRIALLDFWGRRAKRLVPAAALVLTVTWLASRLLLPATRLADTASQIRASALYFQNWQLAWNAVDYLKSDSAASPVQHFWSLSVEEQFYLGWPLLFLLAALVALTARQAEQRRARGHHVALFLAGAVVAGSLWYSVYYTHANPAGAYFVTTTRIWELGLGGLLALLPAGLSQRIGRLGLLGWAGLGLVIASAFVLNGTNAFPGYLALLPAGGAAALILGGSAAGRFGPHRLTSSQADGVHRRHLLLAVPVALAAHRLVHRVERPRGRGRQRAGHRRGRHRALLADQGLGRGQGADRVAAVRARLAVRFHRARGGRARRPGVALHRRRARAVERPPRAELPGRRGAGQQGDHGQVKPRARPAPADPDQAAHVLAAGLPGRRGLAPRPRSACTGTPRTRC